MKNFRVTVNGHTYDVAVEEVAGGSYAAHAPIPQPVQTIAQPAQAPVQTAAEPQVTAPAAPAAFPSGEAGRIVIAAPMPGKILSVKVLVGATVKKGDVVALLEAMKMENEIVASEDGVVASVNTVAGNMINPGETIITLN